MLLSSFLYLYIIETLYICQLLFTYCLWVYTASMSYEVGTHIDLTQLKRGGISSASKRFQEAVSNAYEVGTQIKFQIKDGQTKAARRIPVVYA